MANRDMDTEVEDMVSVDVTPSTSPSNYSTKGKAASFLETIFGHDIPKEEVTLTTEDQKNIQSSITQLEAGLGNAGKNCILSYQRWGQDFWALPEKEIFQGLIQSFWNQILIVVTARKKQILQIKDSISENTFVPYNFPPFEDDMSDFQQFLSIPPRASKAKKYIKNNCPNFLLDSCYKTLKIERGHYNSIKNSIASALNTRGSNERSNQVWEDLLTETIFKRSPKLRLPEDFKNLLLNFLIDPKVQTWSNMINGLVLYKFYSIMRHHEDLKNIWNINKLARDVINKRITNYTNQLSDSNYNVAFDYEDKGKYDDDFLILMRNFNNLDQKSVDEWFRQISYVKQKGNVNSSQFLQLAQTAQPVSVEENEAINSEYGTGDVGRDESLSAGKEPTRKRTSKKKRKEESVSESSIQTSPLRIEKFDFGPGLQISHEIIDDLAIMHNNLFTDIKKGENQKIMQALENMKKYLEDNGQEIGHIVDTFCEVKNLNIKDEKSINEFVETFKKTFSLKTPPAQKGTMSFAFDLNDNEQEDGNADMDSEPGVPLTENPLSDQGQTSQQLRQDKDYEEQIAEAEKNARRARQAESPPPSRELPQPPTVTFVTPKIAPATPEAQPNQGQEVGQEPEKNEKEDRARASELTKKKMAEREKDERIKGKSQRFEVAEEAEPAEQAEGEKKPKTEATRQSARLKARQQKK